jgi:hypothetical protein
MNSSDHALALQAEALLASAFARLREPTKKLAAFTTPRGRQLALALERKDYIFVWAECHEGGIDGVAINNVKRPGLPYAPDQARSSAVNSQCSNLAIGSRAYYLRCESLGALERFAKWYATT